MYTTEKLRVVKRKVITLLMKPAKANSNSLEDEEELKEYVDILN